MHQQRGWSSILAWMGAALLVIAFFGFIARTSPQPDSKPSPPVPVMPTGPEYGSDPKLTMARLRKVAVNTHGDWNAVSDTDKHLIDGLTGGHGRSMFKMMAQGQDTGHSAPPKRQGRDRS